MIRLIAPPAEESKAPSLEFHDCDATAAEALQAARMMPPGLARYEALKMAGLLRCNADSRGLIFTKRGRPRK